MQKMDIHIAVLMNFHIELLEKYGENIKVRNYYKDDSPDPYFLFEHEPSEEVMEFVMRYFGNEGGTVEFSDNGKKFIVYRSKQGRKKIK